MSCFVSFPKAISYHLNGLVRSTARADLVIALGGDGTLLEPVVDRDMHRLLHRLFNNVRTGSVQGSMVKVQRVRSERRISTPRKTLVHAMSSRIKKKVD